MTMRKMCLTVVLLILLISSQSGATTIFPAEVICPNCKTKLKVMVYGSSGSYVYQWPSKFQYVFWPMSDDISLYYCHKCHLTLYSWDFEKLPAEKIGELRKVLATVQVQKNPTDYRKVPMTERLAIAEKIYTNLQGGMEKDPLFWCGFYRVLGYHAAQEKNAALAKASRLKALEIAQRESLDAKNAGRKKELLLIAAAMLHFTGDDRGALEALSTAGGLVYEDKKQPDKAKGVDGYLSALIIEYKKAIAAKRVPADDGATE
jgi:hypothetical protein